MQSLKLYALLFISLSCICGMCSKDDAGADTNPSGPDTTNGNSDNYTEPDLKPADSWIYMVSSGLSTHYGEGNKRPYDRKWIATKVNTATSIKSTTEAGKNYLSFAFENTGKYTRFLTDKLNPGGKEALSIFVKDFNQTPGPGTYTTGISVWYDVYTANGAKVDSTWTLYDYYLKPNKLAITQMTFVSTDGKNSMYKMSGTADFYLYLRSGTNLQDLSCTFNNVPVVLLN